MSPLLIAVLQLIVKEGIPHALQIFQTLKKHGDVTDEMWQDLIDLNKVWTSEKYDEEAAKQANN